MKQYQFLAKYIIIIFIFGITVFFIQTKQEVKGDEISPIIITEVLANPDNTEVNGWNPENTNEYVEIYNNSDGDIDLTGYSITDGDGRDTIEAWINGTHGILNDTDVVTNTLIIPGYSYVVILDYDYEEGMQPYNFPPGTIIMTVDDDTIGTGIGTGGLSKDDCITIYNASGDSVATYGTPVASTSATYGSADDDSLDLIPFLLLNGEQNNSAERIPEFITNGIASYGITDEESAWQMGEDYAGASPGWASTTSPEDNSLNITQIDEQNINSSETAPVLAFQYVNTYGNKMMYIRIINVEDMDISDVTSLKLYNEDVTTIGTFEGTETLIGTFTNTDVQEWELDSLSVNSGTNLLIVLETSESVSIGEKFRLGIPYNAVHAWNNTRNQYPGLNRESVIIK